jgi:hypothetical protein
MRITIRTVDMSMSRPTNYDHTRDYACIIDIITIGHQYNIVEQGLTIIRIALQCSRVVGECEEFKAFYLQFPILLLSAFRIDEFASL